MSNKDEALRAKDLAEGWMRKSDFATARRIALRARKLHENLENLSHMIMVCDVHCAVLEKSGDETDWYKILQVEQDADDNTIRKQYRKFALHLHPDKNKLPGAESAFKTIGEAQRILLDKEKRRLHDLRRNPFKRPAPASQPHQASATGYHTQPVFQTNSNAARNSFFRPEQQKPQPQPQPTGVSGVNSFWTSCAFCHKRYEYQRVYINKIMTCPSCGKQYVACETAFQCPPVQATFHYSQQSKVPTQEAAKKQPENSARTSSRKESCRAKSSSAAENSNRKRKRKKVVESSDSSESSSDCGDVTAGKDSGSTGGKDSRRSVRSKQHVSYKENKSDDDNDILDNNKEERENHFFAETLPNGINRKKKTKKDRAGSSRNAVKGLSSGSETDVEIFECADPDFSNFEKSREESCFKAGQTWAMYDNMDKMPRYYAIIRKVVRNPGFMVKITWLEADPDDEKVQQWVRRKLPVSVGKFKIRGDENIKGTLSFSHEIHCRIGSMKDSVSVYPRRGETWALFKNWDMKWSTGHRHSSHEYQYEFVEILSEYAEGVAIDVGCLRKVKGFASVFHPGGGSLKVLPHEFLRFSHRIASTKLTGKEGRGVPAGSYELDTAALPQKMEEEEEETVPVSGEAAKSTRVHHRSRPSPDPDCMVIPKFDFHDFCSERLEGKFAIGQIWSLNSKEDDLPKCYAKVKQIVWKPIFVLHINRLELKSLPENVTQWRDKKMPVSCGNFTVKEGRGEAEELTTVIGFSHQIKAQEGPKNEYSVLPKTGEIWAMYKNWSATIKVANLKKCEYEVVEVLDDIESHIEVMVLERVPGFNSVFKEKVEGSMDVKKKIRRCELLRFSHFVPAFRLTGERDGALRGFLELDPAALPRNLRRS